ncbi:helix-turn-helix domain-containing protein [Kineosporia babensis]
MALLLDKNSNPFEVGCACEIFGPRPYPELERDLYRLTVVAADDSVTMRDGLFQIRAPGRLVDIDSADTIIVPNRPETGTASNPAILQAIRRAHARGARLVGLCSGAFVLAEAGVLEGRKVAVHWQLVDELRNQYPAVHVAPDVLFVDEGDVLTSAGGAASFDLALHIVRTDHGAEIASHVGRRLVFASFRDGAQQQVVQHVMPEPTESPLAPVLQWANERLPLKLTVEAMARQGQMSPRALHRRFRDEIGSTPMAWVTAQRVALACRLIEQSDLSMNLVARKAGLGTDANLRLLFQKHVGVAPSEYRKRFAPDTTPRLLPAE